MKHQPYFLAVIAGFILIFCGLTGCDRNEYSLARHGIGAALYAPDADNVSELQDMYFDYLCQQSGVSVYHGNQFDGACQNAKHVDGFWTLIVHQGMNDIDRRCDRYLEWLDDRKRSQGPILAQIGTIRDTTNAILGFAVPGARAIEVVAQGFGLITKSIENYHSRLILEIESSTVNALVLKRRDKFRIDTAKFNYRTKPAAEYILRRYLRICLPFAIETEINDFSTLGASGVLNPSLFSIHNTPPEETVPGVEVAGKERQFGAIDAIPEDPSLPEDRVPAGAISNWERNIQKSDLAIIQRYMCIADPAFAFGPRTRAGIKMWSAQLGGDGDSQLTSREGAKLLSEAKKLADCKTQKFKNIYERIIFSSPELEREFVANLHKKLGVQDLLGGDGTLSSVRADIARYTRQNPTLRLIGVSDDEVTNAKYKQILFL